MGDMNRKSNYVFIRITILKGSIRILDHLWWLLGIDLIL